jgi:putative peptidoglycan lipid II flippase
LAYGFSFGKSLVVAHYFGTSGEMDAFALAVLLPNLLASLLTGGFAISLVPALATAELKSKDERSNTFRAGLLLFTAITTIAAVLLAMFSQATMAVVAPGFNAGKQMLAAGLLRWCAALLPLNAVYAYCSAELLSRRRYAMVAGAPAISTFISVAALLLFPSAGVKILAIGLIAGTFVQASGVAVPALSANRLGRQIRWWTPEVKRLLREQAPLLVISSFGVVNLSVDQFMAGLLQSGSAAALNFAANLNTVVNQVVVMSASWVLLPELSRLAAEGDHEALKTSVRDSIRGIAILAVPVATVIFVLGGTAVRVLFQHGRFNSNSTQQVSRIWVGYTLGLLPFAVGIVPVRMLNAMRQNHFMVKVGAVALIINGALDYLFMQWLGPVGISLSTSLVYVCTAILVCRFANKLIPGLLVGRLLADMVWPLLICIPAGAALWAFRQIFDGLAALLAGGMLFTVAVSAIYLRLGLVPMPLKKVRTVPAQ